MSDTKEHLEKRRNYWMNECGKLEVRITALESTISDHEEDSAALPEDMSITETIKMKDKRIDTLTRDLAIHKRALELAITISEYNLECPRELDGDSNCGKIYFDPDTQECSLPEDKWIYCWIDKFITEATAEIDKEATDD